MIVIGLIGEKGSGKGTFTDILREVLPDKRIVKVGSSELLFETLNLWGIQTTRENLINLAEAMDSKFGKGTLSRAISNRISHVDADIVIFDSVRWDTDVDVIRQFPDGLLVYITADSRTRHERTVNRGEKVGEAEATFEEFRKQEQASTEIDIPRLGSMADYGIVNHSSDKEIFKNAVRIFCRRLLKLKTA